MTLRLCARCGAAGNDRRRVLVTQITVEAQGWAVDTRGPLEHLAQKPRLDPGAIREMLLCEPCVGLFCREHGLPPEAIPAFPLEQ